MTSRAIQMLSVDDHVAYLRKSSIPTIIVEGNDDLVIYRYIERRFGAVNISILPVGGRKNVLSIFDRRTEINTPLFFIADRDNWCITGVPDKYNSEQIALTSGYSIENDVILDGNLMKYLDEKEEANLRRELDTFIAWYALALSRHLASEGAVIKTHPNTIIDDVANCAQLSILADGEIYPEALKNKLSHAPFELVRGKSVFAVLMRQISYSGRKPKHHHLSLMETVGASPGDRIDQIFERVSDFFNLTHLSHAGTVT